MLKKYDNDPMRHYCDNPSNTCWPIAAIALCVILVTAGCNQRRYKPSKWRAAARQSTLPVNEEAMSDSAWGSDRGTLPFRNADGSTLPNRGWSTLPNRGWSTLPNRGGMSTLPGRGWSTLPDRRGNGSTLPNRGVYPEYALPQRNWSTLPQRGAPEIGPLRGGSTLPNRGNPLRWK